MSCKSLKLFAAGIVLLLLALDSAWAQGLARQQIDCERYGEEKAPVQMSEFCAPGEYTNACYNAFSKATRERDEYNAAARECKRRSGTLNNSPPPVQPRSGRAGQGNNSSHGSSNNSSSGGTTSDTGSSVTDRLNALSKQKAGETPMTKQRLDQLRREHNQVITDSQRAYNKRQQEVADERRQLDADLAEERRNKAKIQEEIDADDGPDVYCGSQHSNGYCYRYCSHSTKQCWRNPN